VLVLVLLLVICITHNSSAGLRHSSHRYYEWQSSAPLSHVLPILVCRHINYFFVSQFSCSIVYFSFDFLLFNICRRKVEVSHEMIDLVKHTKIYFVFVVVGVVVVNLSFIPATTSPYSDVFSF